MTKEANPLVWGAVAAVGAALIVALTTVSGSASPDNAFFANPLKAAGGAFVWGAAIALFRNWLARRRL